MKRLIDYYLRQWKESSMRKSLLLRGARQVGKTYAVRELGKTFEAFVEINFESNKKARTFFESDLDPRRILREIAIITGTEVVPGKTLLFFDEIQVVPEGITALRYFYEMMPELHVVAAGSLVDFAIQQVGVPVGRIQFLYMYPMSFIEYACALGQGLLVDELMDHAPQAEIGTVIHQKALDLVGNYLATGGMPQMVSCWRDTQSLLACAQIPQTLVAAYQYDFVKYGKSHQIKYLDVLFSHIPQQLGKKFKYSLIGDFRKRELEPCVELLATAGVVHRVTHADGQGVPLGAQVDFDTFKLLFIDVGLSQLLLDLRMGDWLLDPLREFVNKGMLVEAFVGQELVAYQNATYKTDLYYWKRDARGSEAEVDYLVQLARRVIPIEVKSGGGSTLRSMHAFLDGHKESPYGIRLSTNNYSMYENIHSYPLYAVAKIIAEADNDVRAAVTWLRG